MFVLNSVWVALTCGLKGQLCKFTCSVKKKFSLQNVSHMIKLCSSRNAHNRTRVRTAVCTQPHLTSA